MSQKSCQMSEKMPGVPEIFFKVPEKFLDTPE